MTDYQKLRIEKANHSLDSHGKFFHEFVSIYKNMVSIDEVRAIFRSKMSQPSLTQIVIFDQTQALINFIYRHFHYLSNLKEIKKMVVIAYQIQPRASNSSILSLKKGSRTLCPDLETDIWTFIKNYLISRSRI
jgi:hypothetical protein